MKRSSWSSLVGISLLVAIVAVGAWIARRSPPAQRGLMAASGRPASVERDQPAPLFALPNVDGQVLNLESEAGNVVLVNFWATWCEPCRAEMPVVERAYQQHYDAGFRVLAVNVQERPEQVRGYAQTLGLTFPIVLDAAGEVKNSYRVQFLPRSFFIARDGRVIHIHPGELTPDTIERYLKELL